MSALFPNGTVFSVSTAYAAPAAISAISNADPAVATTATEVEAGTIGVLTTGWARLTDRVVRAAASTATTFQVEGIDTTDVNKYPAGQGAGTLLGVTSWVDLSQVTQSSKSGGDQQFYQWQYLEDANSYQRQRPTYKNAKSLALTLDYDPALAWYAALIAADENKDAVVLRARLPNGAVLYYYVYPSFDADPSTTLNQNMQNTATFSLVNGNFARFDS